MIRTHRQIADIITGYPLDDVIEIVVPVARTNLITNGSFETNTTSWSAIGGSIARSTAAQYHGAYSLAITPTAALLDGARYDTVSLTSGVTYAYSAKVKGVAGLKYTLNIETNGGVSLGAQVTFTANGRWQWVYGYWTETSTTTRRVTVRKGTGNTSTGVFYADGVQVEAIGAGETVSTYLDGDQVGLISNQQPPAFYWNGTPHASTSTRSGLTRAGGMVVRLSKYNFLLTAIIGLGLTVPTNASTEYARIDGGNDDYTRKPTRQFSLAGTFQSSSYQQLRDKRGSLAALLDRDAVGLDQRMLIRHRLEDTRGNVQSETSIIPAKYAGGLDGKSDNHYAESAALTFTQYLPVIQLDGEAGASLTVQQTVSNTNRIAERLPDGTWRAISNSFNNAINAVLYAPDGKLYMAGDFTAPHTRMAVWDGSTLSALSTGLNASVLSLVAGPDGAIYAGGATFTVGGNTGSVAKWDGAALSIVGATGTMTNSVQQLLFAADGTLYAAGNNGATHATLDKWNGSAWSNIITHGALSTMYALALGLDGKIYAGGTFTNLNADANQDGIAVYSPSAGTWAALGTGLGVFGISGQGLTLGLDGRLYVHGNFTSVGGVTASGAAIWNGTIWTPMGAGLTASGDGVARTLADGSIIVGGAFTGSGGVTFPDPLARWNGSIFVALDANLPASSGNRVLALATALDGRLAVTYNNTGSATAAALTTATNIGSARAYPTLIIRGPSSGTARIYQIVNTTTGRAIYLNLTINAGETVTMRFWPDSLAFQSTFQGNVASAVLAGSNEADFFLQPGANTISFFAADSSVTAVLVWRPSYASLDKVP